LSDSKWSGQKGATGGPPRSMMFGGGGPRRT
jgi:hypothetical protein